MKIILKENKKYIVRLDPGEEITAALSDFYLKEGIRSCFFTAIGAAQDLVIAWYNLDTKKYEDKNLSERLEIISLTGNVGIKGNDVIVHAHGSFSDLDMKTYAGHVKKAIVSATCEVFIEVFEGLIERAYDEKTGLNLMQ